MLQKIQARGANIQSLPDLPVSQQLLNLRSQEATLSHKVAEFAARYSDGHPFVVNARLELRDVQSQIFAELKRMGTNAVSYTHLDVYKRQASGCDV